MTESNQQLVQRFIEEFWNKQQLKAADTYLAPEFIARGERLGPEGFKRFAQALWGTYPDIRFHILDCVAMDDKVAVRVIEQGPHQEARQSIRAAGIGLFQIADGKIVQQWFHDDFDTEMRQLALRLVPGTE